MGRGGLRKGRELTLGGFGLPLDELEPPVTSRTLFGNQKPLELEVGSGKGTLLVRESERRPDVNFLGIEYQKRYFRLAADRLRRHGRDNVRVVHAEASRFLTEFLPDGSLEAVHVYFPDPWPKRRHHGRRFIQPATLELLASKLRPGGRVQIVTDHLEYFRHIERVVAASSLRKTSFDPLDAAGPEEIVGTNFERKYLREGRTFYPIAAERVLEQSR